MRIALQVCSELAVVSPLVLPHPLALPKDALKFNASHAGLVD